MEVMPGLPVSKVLIGVRLNLVFSDAYYIQMGEMQFCLLSKQVAQIEIHRIFIAI
jgi:hypothetical protein